MAEKAMLNAPDRAQLVKNIIEIIAFTGEVPENVIGPLSHPGCNCEFTYETIDDIPTEDVICEHGNNIIIYGE